MLDALDYVIDFRTMIGILLGAIVTGMLSLWLARSAERRKAYTDLVGPIHDRLLNFSGHEHPEWPSVAELHHLRSLIGRRRFKRVCKALERCQHRYESQRRSDPATDYSGIYNTNHAEIAAAIEEALKAMPRS